MKKRHPYKYTQARANRFIEAIEGMSGVVEASKCADITYITYRNWYNDIPEFKERVDEAMAKADQSGKEYAVQQIFKNMEKNWTAAAWWLERRFQDDYGKKTFVEQNVNYTEPMVLKIVPPQLPEAEETKEKKKLNK